MSFEMALWQVSGDRLEPMCPGKLDQESRLERWIYSDPSILGLDIAVIGRQVQTAYGGRIDLLAMDREANCVILELKRDKTPREIVAQVLDYATWVKGLGYAELDQICQSNRQKPLAAVFHETFDEPIPEPVNASHRMVVIASSLDDSSERIIDYLAEDCGVGINAVFFRFFKNDGAEHLGRAWLKNPVEVFDRAEGRKRAPWSGYWFANVGEGDHRTWSDNMQYGYLGAGQGEKYSRPLGRLQIGDGVFAYMRGLGYVGYGVVRSTAVPIGAFTCADGARLIDQPMKAPKPTEHMDDPRLSEWAVGVDWQRTVPREQAKTFKGIFANQNIVCKLSDQATVDFVKREFGLQADT